VQTGKKN